MNNFITPYNPFPLVWSLLAANWPWYLLFIALTLVGYALIAAGSKERHQ
jgi:hypothetical protein